MSIKPTFTEDWFSQNIPIWESVLTEFKDKPINAIELGSYEGRSAIWLLDNILTNEKAHLDIVDTWTGGGELDDIDFEAVEKRFWENIGPYTNKITVNKISTTDYLKERTEPADLIYVDGGHFAAQALIDSVLSHLLLKPGGILIFDDYMIGGLLHTPTTPKTAIDAFTECFAQEYDWLVLGYQVLLRKKI